MGKTVVTKQSGTVNNKVKFSGIGIETKTVTSEELSAKQFAYVGGNFDPKKGALQITKLDAEEKDVDGNKLVIANNEAAFTLWYKLNNVYIRFGGEDAVFKTDNGILRIGNLPLRTYYLRESVAPNGYVSLDGEIEVSVNTAYNNNPTNIVEITIENTKIKTQITGTKIWVNGPETKPAIQLQLYRNGAAFGDTVTLENRVTSYTWTGLDKTDIDGNEYVYTVDELAVPEGYEKSVQTNGNSVNIINSYKINKGDITVVKIWHGGPNAKPIIQLQLYRDGTPYRGRVTLLDGMLSYTWNDLELNSNTGHIYDYTVKEVTIGGSEVIDGEVVNNYRASLGKDSNGQFIITNTYVSPKIEVTGTKTWINGPEERPAIQLQLYRQIENGTRVSIEEPVTLDGTEENPWTYTWDDLDQTDFDGDEYIYTLEEVEELDNYISVAEDLDVTNYYVIPKIDITGTKTWIGGPAEKPSIQLQLYRQIGEDEKEAVEDPITLDGTEDKPWSHTWVDIDQTNIAGEEYTYTVEEVEAPENYTSEAEGQNVTNTYVSPKIDVTGTKTWVNGPEKKPTVQLQLFRQIEGGNLEKVGEPVTLESGTIEHKWTGLDKTDFYENEYIYTLDEVVTPENYFKTLSEDGLTVTNTYVSPKIEVTGTKVWDGAPLEKPDIEIQLFRDGEAYGDPVLFENGTTNYTWIDLDKTDDNGVDYKYTIDEVSVPIGYKKNISEDGLTVTNSYDEELGDKTPGGPTLPKTGAASTLGFYIIGVTLILLGVLGILFKRKQSA